MAEQTLLEKALDGVENRWLDRITRTQDVLFEHLDLLVALTEKTISRKNAALVLGKPVRSLDSWAGSTLYLALKRGLIDVRRIP